MTCVGGADSGTPNDQLGGGGANPTSALGKKNRVVWPTAGLFDPHVCSLPEANELLISSHYLGPIERGFPWRCELGVMVFGNPSSRRLPQHRWVELLRWCIIGGPNSGSQMWAWFRRWLRRTMPTITTVVSYSDPSVGHTGALYRASGWLWAPTHLRLAPPPSGNGNWGGDTVQPVKDRWIFPVTVDHQRQSILTLRGDHLVRRMPWASYREGVGGDYQRWIAEQDKTPNRTRSGERNAAQSAYNLHTGPISATSAGAKSLSLLVRPAGLEPATHGLQQVNIQPKSPQNPGLDAGKPTEQAAKRPQNDSEVSYKLQARRRKP